MNRDGRRDFGLIILSCLVACLTVGVIALALAAHSGLSTDNREITQLQQQNATTQQVIATLRASVNGSHRDLITCGDLSALINGESTTIGLNSLLGDISTAAGDSGLESGETLPLPAHCINQ